MCSNFTSLETTTAVSVPEWLGAWLIKRRTEVWPKSWQGRSPILHALRPQGRKPSFQKFKTQLPSKSLWVEVEGEGPEVCPQNLEENVGEGEVWNESAITSTDTNTVTGRNVSTQGGAIAHGLTLVHQLCLHLLLLCKLAPNPYLGEVVHGGLFLLLFPTVQKSQVWNTDNNVTKGLW